jgi:negative regulator of sigma E activity
MLTDKRKEKLSAFLDNDLHRDELMSFSLSAEEEDAAQVQRYQILGDVLRSEMSDASFINVSQAVREALANENIADQMPTAQHSAAPNTVTESQAVASGRASAWSLSALLRPAAGMAVAASVALVMVVSISQQEIGTLAPNGPVASNTQQPAAQPVMLQLAAEEPTKNESTAGGVTVSHQAAGNDAKLNQRLVNQHLEFATQDTMQGRLPYVRAVSFEPEK